MGKEGNSVGSAHGRYAGAGGGLGGIRTPARSCRGLTLACCGRQDWDRCGTIVEQKLHGVRVGRTKSLLSPVIRPFIAHPLGDGAQFLLLVGSSNSWALSAFCPCI